MAEREAGRARLYPSFFSPRYYYLKQLSKAIIDVVTKFVAGNNNLKVVDYGCGNSPYKEVFAPHVEQYIGVDLPENKKADVTILPTGRIDLNDSTIDLVLSTQVLEHVEDPTHYLSEANRILKTGGKLVLSTHGYWMFHPDPTDYWRWTSAGLKKIITQAGFEVIYFEGILGRASMGLQLFQDGLIFKLPKSLRFCVSLILQPLIYLFDKIGTAESRRNDACTFIVVARKK